LTQDNQNWENRYTALEEKYKLVLFRKFGRSSEEDSKQPLLFEESSDATEETESETNQVKNYTRKSPGRKPLDDKLPREEKIIDIPEEEKHCACGADLVRIGEEVSEKLQIVPEKIWVEKTVRPKWACKNCEGSGDEEKATVRVAPAQPSLIPQSIVTPGLLAFILVNKYVDHLPFYRQEKRFERIGITISRQNMSNWQTRAFHALTKLFDLLKTHLGTGPVMQMDETTVQVMGEEGRQNTQKSYMWLARGGPPEEPVVIYEYHQTRAFSNIHGFLEGYKGYLQTDGYEGYVTALKDHPDIIHVGCFAHARRKFFEASKVSKKPGSAMEGIKHIQKLYQIEGELRSKELPENDFLEQRQQQVAPVLEKFKSWLDKRASKIVPSSPVGKAIHYTLKEWEKLVA
ncbi:MAG: IS66 family transposase, partial [Bacteroidales bacterium]|nr:IS66 family transposase [Bacteroidales bacterium]